MYQNIITNGIELLCSDKEKNYSLICQIILVWVFFYFLFIFNLLT